MRRLPPIAALVFLSLVCFARLVARPAGWLVDGERASVDAARIDGPARIGNDLTRFHLPKLLKIAASLRRTGRPPYWDRFGFGGRPFVGNPQAGLYYPPYWLAWLWPDGATLSWITVAHLIWGGVGAYVLARGQGLGRFAATVAGGCFEASPYLLAQTFEGHLPHVWAVSWYPWAFWAAVRLQRGDWRGGWLLPPILTLMLLSGHPQEFFLPAIAFAAWALVAAIKQARAGRTKAARAGLGLWILIGATTLGMSAVELAPILNVRTLLVVAPGSSPADADHYHVDPINVLQLFSPRALGGPADFRGRQNYWETLLSFGWMTLVLAVLGLQNATRGSPARGWGALAISAIVFAAGRKLGLFILIYEIVPGAQWFRVPARALFLASLAVALLAGFGVQALLDPLSESRNHDQAARRYRIMLLIGILISAPFEFAREPIFLTSLAGGSIAIEWLKQRPRDHKAIAYALGALALLELGGHGFNLIRVAAAERFGGRDPIAETIALDRPEGPFRIRARDAFYGDLRAVRAGLEKTNAEDLFQIDVAADLYKTLYPMFQPNNPHALTGANVRQAVLDRMNVAFLVTDHPEPNAVWPLVATGTRQRNESYYLYKNGTFLPRAYVVPRVRVAIDDARNVAELLPIISPRAAVVMPIDPLKGVEGARQEFKAASIEYINDNRLIVRVTTEAPGLLVIGETWTPGWSATLDGRSVEFLRGDRAWRVIPLRKPGAHVVEMSYEPPGLTTGALITLATFLIWLATRPTFGNHSAAPLLDTS